MGDVPSIFTKMEKKGNEHIQIYQFKTKSSIKRAGSGMVSQ